MLSRTGNTLRSETTGSSVKAGGETAAVPTGSTFATPSSASIAACPYAASLVAGGVASRSRSSYFFLIAYGEAGLFAQEGGSKDKRLVVVAVQLPVFK